MDKYQIIVIGGGHAGVEAAAAAARMGAHTCLITHSAEKIGEMSCNPAIGGIGKSHLAKEVDALGGLMARAADMAGIHYRVLNSTKGQAVRATRVQTDRDLYKLAIQKLLKECDNLTILESSVEDIIIKGEEVCSVLTDQGQTIIAEKLVLTTGTFLGGVMHTGLEQKPGGRVGDPPSIKLAERLRKLPLSVSLMSALSSLIISLYSALLVNILYGSFVPRLTRSSTNTPMYASCLPRTKGSCSVKARVAFVPASKPCAAASSYPVVPFIWPAKYRPLVHLVSRLCLSPVGLK